MPIDLLPTQVNYIVRLLVTKKWDLTRFYWDAARTRQGQPDIDVLRLRDSPFYFAFDHGGAGNWLGRFSPGNVHRTTRTPEMAWNFVIANAFSPWLDYLRREVEAPDLWGELQRGSELIAGVGEGQAENSRFAADEIKAISERVEEIRRHLLEMAGADPLKSDTVNRKLDYLIDATQRLGRFDWRQAAFGVLVQLGIDVLSRDQSAWAPPSSQQ